LRLAWNAIVRDEQAVIERCVRSLLPHIDCGIVVDTGSSDGTPEKILRLFRAAGKSIEIQYSTFVNFEQARNEALRVARASELAWDYLVLVDADMELVVQRPLQVNGGLAYDMLQQAGDLRYYNRRLVSRQAVGNYIGVTHEFLDVETAGKIDGAYFIDHADGASRPQKYQRDIAMLEEALQTETRPQIAGRYLFYLARTYFDSGEWAKAAENYRKRAELAGGYDEEQWDAQLHYAHCLDNLGDQAGFVLAMLRAYEMRLHRAEALYDLAKHFRLRGDNLTSLLFSDLGARVPDARGDMLFVNSYVYTTGLKEEFAICAYYDPARRARGAAACNELALSRAASAQSREQARANQFWYLKPLAAYVPSFAPRRIVFDAPAGYVAMNPSVINEDGRATVLLRTVNYTITPEGAYAIRGPDGGANSSNPIHTRNFLVRLSGELTIEESHELALPVDWPEPKFDLVRGFEDSRLFNWDGKLWAISTVRELTPEGWCEQVVAKVSSAGYGDWWQLLPTERKHEKNWMPFVNNDGAWRLVYRLGTLANSEGDIVARHEPPLDVGHISGGSQVIEAEGTYLALVHEARTIPGRPNRYYQHRFVVLAEDGRLVRISPPFVFFDRQIEFAAGLAYFPAKRQLMASFGVMDREAWLAWMDLDQVLAFVDWGRP
jgi:glycosyltransferase involved in cell wall biosynthesis